MQNIPRIQSPQRDRSRERHCRGEELGLWSLRDVQSQVTKLLADMSARERLCKQKQVCNTREATRGPPAKKLRRII